MESEVRQLMEDGVSRYMLHYDETTGYTDD
jgi:hypothetical protein